MNPFWFEPEIDQAVAEAVDERERAAVRTSLVRQRLPEAVRLAGWTFLGPQDKLDLKAEGRCLVIGVVPWNPAELEVLSRIYDSATTTSKYAVFVFDLDDHANLADLARVIPGVTAPLQTPVFAEYREGTMYQAGEGREAMRLLRGHVDS